MPLTYIEWLKVNKHPNTTAGEIIIEAYARYYHSELSSPPKDESGESVRFAEWAMNNNYVPDVIEKKYWLSDFDAPNGVEPYTTEQLYSLFKKESNG